jgi:hypothetical protein
MEGAMKTSFFGTIVDGTLQLDELLPLANHSRVQVTVISLDENRRRWTEALTALRELRTTNPIVTGLPRPRRDELYDRR